MLCPMTGCWLVLENQLSHASPTLRDTVPTANAEIPPELP